jgi:hypothetical protein
MRLSYIIGYGAALCSVCIASESHLMAFLDPQKLYERIGNEYRYPVFMGYLRRYQTTTIGQQHYADEASATSFWTDMGGPRSFTGAELLKILNLAGQAPDPDGVGGRYTYLQLLGICNAAGVRVEGADQNHAGP